MEIWKDLVGYESTYEVSDRGRIRSKTVAVNCGLRHNETRVRQGRVLKNNKKRNGYLAITLSATNVKKDILVHRAVAEAFLPQQENKCQVNHKNFDKTDNRVSNLEWVTAKENSRHSRINGNQGPSPLRKEILCVETRAVFPSSYQAAQWLNETKFEFSKDVASMARSIRGCASGKQFSAYGYKWRDLID